MEIFSIPIQDKFILYRPLLRLAFVGNQAMADLALDLANRANCDADAPEEAMTFLQAIGFLKPDPPPPPPQVHSYHPTTTVLLLTNRCNLRCTYCYANGGEGPMKSLSLKSAQMVIDQTYQNALDLGHSRFELVFHGGGEPVQAWDTLQAATVYARDKDLPCRVVMVSNGIWTARQREWILKNLDGVSISFDGRLETQNHQRPFASGRGSFKAAMRTIKALDRAEFSYGIRMTATAPWQEQFPKDVRFICEETECPAIQVEPAFNTLRGEHRGPTQEDSQAFVHAFMEAFEIAQQAGRRLIYSGARPWLLASTFCTAPYNALIANVDGNLVTCYEITGATHPLVELSTVGQIADSKIIIDHQARSDGILTHLDEKRAACRECFCYWHCAGDCYTRSFYAQASDQGASSRCIMNREITARILLWYIMAEDGVWRGRGMRPQEVQLLRTS